MKMDSNSTPIPVKRALQKLGRDLRDARKRRRIPMLLAAQRAGISRTTLDKVEKGDEGVGVAAYVRVLFIMGMVQRFADLADPQYDHLGIQLEIEQLPKRIRIPRGKT
jgi:hypothetical protein